MVKSGLHKPLRFGEGGCGKRRKYFLMAKAGALSVALALCPAPKSQAASFDCGKATTTVEKMICVDAGLSRLDEELNRVYKEALKRSPEPEELKRNQKEWLKYWQSRCETDEECVQYQWKYQIERLSNIVNSPLHKLQDTVFRYELEESYNDQVCQHMLGVFNSKFSMPWASEPTGFWTGTRSPKNGHQVFKENPSYAEHGKYAFPKLPGVNHDVRQTFEMRHTKMPTSPEFDLVPWHEGRRKNEGVISSMLVADFDIDNDGIMETVIKVGFWGNGNVYSIHIPWDSYYIYKQSDIDPTKITDYVVLGKKARYSIEGRYVRPFIFKGKTYLTSYEPFFGILEDSTRVETPKAEDMVVQVYHKETNFPPAWREDICRYQMIAVGSIDATIEKEK